MSEKVIKTENKVNYRPKYKKFGGIFIDDIIDYLGEIIEREPEVTISIGNDSIQRRRKTQYANTIMVYNTDIRNGAHVVFFRESIPKVFDTFERLYKEAQYTHDIGHYLHEELDKIGYKRKDLSVDQRKAYKYHLLKCQGMYQDVALHDEIKLVENMHLTPGEETMEYKLVDIHVDFNPFAGIDGRNKSYAAFKSAVPWLQSEGFRVYAKNIAWAATSAADLLLKD